MRKKHKKLEIKKDQLLSEKSFIRFCNDDPANGQFLGRRMEITEPFLRAAEKDDLIMPILQVEEEIRQDDGTKKMCLVNYYSRHQIYLVAELRRNKVNENGYLWDDKGAGWIQYGEKKEALRMVAWGLHGWINKDSLNKTPVPNNEWLSIASVSRNLHNFLELLHGLEPKPDHLIREEKRRLWSDASILDYNFEKLKTGGKRLLELYELDTQKINLLRKHVGYFAERIDPLAHWYYYIKKHPELKKDLLKGDASLAQEIYRLYDLLTEIWEMVAQSKSEPLFEFLYKDEKFGLPNNAPKTEYLHGEDIKALKYSVEQFKKWKRKKDNKPFVGKEVIKKIAIVEKALTDFAERYGDRSYTGIIETGNEEILELDKLDVTTKIYAEMTLKQDLEQKVGDTPSTEMLKEHIALAIWSRLGDLQRRLRRIFLDISRQFRDKEDANWQEINNNNLWMKLTREGKFEGLDYAQQVQLANTERKKIEVVAKEWEEKSKEFHKTVAWYADIVFCKVCKEKPVRQHSEDGSINMLERNRSLICDDCLKSVSEQTRIKDSEWHCDYCEKLLYRFVAHNLVSDMLINTANVKIRLEYGKMRIAARCPNRSCKKENEKTINWGWMP